MGGQTLTPEEAAELERRLRDEFYANPVVERFEHLIAGLGPSPVEPFRVYGIALHTRAEGLDRQFAQYLTQNWRELDSMTGPEWLLLWMQTTKRGKPTSRGLQNDHAYALARAFGYPPDALPAIVFFTNPGSLRKTVAVELRKLWPVGADATPEQFTDFFRVISRLCDQAGRADKRRMAVLGNLIEKQWPSDSEWNRKASAVGGGLLRSVAPGATILASLAAIASLVP